MHARELVELAAIASAHGPVLIQSGEPIPAQSIEQYWTTSKVRLDRWAWHLKHFSITNETPSLQKHFGTTNETPSQLNRWAGVRGVLEEILVGEMLTRTWTAVLCAYDRRRGADETEPVARSVLIGHMEARHRVLTFMVRNQGIDAEAAMKLNRLRRRAERWTDLLIGYLLGMHDVSEFAFDPRRATDFAEDLRYQNNLPGGRHVWPLMMASMRSAFHQGLCNESPNADLNVRIAASILSCFPSELFDSTGLMRSMWLMRLTNIADDTQGKIDELLRLECPTTLREPAGKRMRWFGGQK